MIVDRLANSRGYEGLHPLLAPAFDFLHACDWATLADGRHELDGDRLFALAQTYETKQPEQAFWESHRKYLDVQYIIEGVEQMGVAALDAMTVRAPYDREKDLMILDGTGDRITVPAGSFAVFLPQDVHMPCLAVGNAARVRKVVVKAAIEVEAAAYRHDFVCRLRGPSLR